MKLSVVAVLLIIAVVHAFPQNEIETSDDRFLITNAIRNAIKKLSQDIRDGGLDPVQIKEVLFEYKAVPGFAEVEAFMDNFEFSGLSNIAMNRLSHNGILRRVSFDLSLPELRLTLRESGFDANVFGTKHTGRFNGSISIKQIRVSGHANYRVLINTGISDISLNFSLGGIESNIRLIAFGEDYSEYVMTFLDHTVPKTISENTKEINKFLEDYIMGLLKGQ